MSTMHLMPSLAFGQVSPSTLLIHARERLQGSSHGLEKSQLEILR
jgi:hypothetical protein